MTHAFCRGVGAGEHHDHHSASVGAGALLPCSEGLGPAEGVDYSGATGRLKRVEEEPCPSRGLGSSYAKSCVSGAALGPARWWGWKGRCERRGAADRGAEGELETGSENLAPFGHSLEKGGA